MYSVRFGWEVLERTISSCLFMLRMVKLFLYLDEVRFFCASTKLRMCFGEVFYELERRISRKNVCGKGY